MERIKKISKLLLCISLLLFATTFLDVMYPKGDQAPLAYQQLIDKYIEIGSDSYIIETDMQEIITKEEFDSNIAREDVKNRVYTLLASTKNVKYIFDEEQLQNISEQFALMYDQQQISTQNTAYTSVINPLRTGFISIIVIMSILYGICIIVEKKGKNME